MTEPYTVEHPLMVLTRRQTAEDAGRIGFLDSSQTSYTGIPHYVCVESDQFLHSKRQRAKVAREIVSHLSENCVQVFVIVHKHDYQFVYAQLGLADELLKLLHGGVHIVIACEDGGTLLARIKEVIRKKKRRKSTRRSSPAPLVDSFEESSLLVLKDLIKRARSTRNAGA